MKIIDEDIYGVERLLLPNGGKFDLERREVIKCLETKDIKACPGSGKTTTLIAKLMILSERMPFQDGRGICVLTHTNVAIDKIKEKLGSKSDILFSYPNYFGTFQSFVDKFLAIPAQIKFTGKRPRCIDNDVYNVKSNFKLKYYYDKNQSKEENNIAKHWLHKHDGVSNIRFSYHEKGILINLKTDKEINLNKNAEDESKIYLWIKNFKNDLIKEEGIVTFEEAYMLANRYLSLCPQLKDSFSERFKYVFVDEMQDSDVPQKNIIEMLFNDKVVVQRFGDPHQAIYDKVVVEEEIWKPVNYLPISESKRFGSEIANRLKTICIEHNKELKGNLQVASLTPHIIVFDDSTIDNVINTFAELIHEHKLDEKLDDKDKLIFKAVGWVGKERKEDEKHKLCLGSYFDGYQKSNRDDKKNNFKNLKSYLRKQFPGTIDKCGAKIYLNVLVNAFVKILDDAGIKNTSGKKESYFTPSTFLSYLKENHEEKYVELRRYLSDWICAKQNSEEPYYAWAVQSIREFVRNNFNNIWSNFEYAKVKKFMEDEEAEIKDNECKKNNIFKKTFEDNGTEVSIEVATIHSVKGETHKATLYLETYYYKYESEKILDFIVGEFNQNNVQKERKALKMAYVGMSRPTHLLCLAMHKDRIKWRLKELDIKNNPIGWKILDLTTSKIQ